MDIPHADGMIYSADQAFNLIYQRAIRNFKCIPTLVLYLILPIIFVGLSHGG
jgi:hypothetical protein